MSLQHRFFHLRQHHRLLPTQVVSNNIPPHHPTPAAAPPSAAPPCTTELIPKKTAALLFAGRIKSWEVCHDSFKQHILGPLSDYTVDGYLCHNANNPLPNIERFKELYHIRDMRNISVNYEDIATQVPLALHCGARYTSLIMFRCWLEAFQMVELSGIKYDIIIYLRADQIFKSPLVIPAVPLPSNTIYVPHGNDFVGGLNDQFAVGDYNSMRHYTSIYNNIINIYKSTNMMFHTETYVRIHNRPVHIIRIHLHYSLSDSRV